MNAEKRYELLTKSNVKVAICRLAIPTIFSMLITSLYNTADSYFVSKLGSGAIGAVGVIFSFMAIIQACGFFFGHGSGNYISRKLGKQDVVDAKQMAATGYYLSFTFGILIAILGIIFIEPLAKSLGSDDIILPYATIYLMYILIGAPFMCASLTMNNQLRFQGNAFYGMIGMCSGALLNILGDSILVPRFGMHGAGISTLVSQIISFILLRIGIIKSGNVEISIKNLRLSKHLLLEIVNGGSPSLLRQSIGSVATILLNNILVRFGTDAVASMSVVLRITQIPFSIVMGLGQGYQPVCGFNYGAGKYDRVKEGFYFLSIVTFAAMVVMAVLCFVFAEQLVLLFCQNADKIENLELFTEMGISTLRIHCFTLPIITFFSNCSMMFQTMGKSIRASLLAISRQGLFFIPTLIILKDSYKTVRFVQPISDVLSFILAIIFFITIIRELSFPKKENIVN